MSISTKSQMTTLGKQGASSSFPAHKLKPNEGNEFPRYLAFLDCEAWQVDIDEKTHDQFFDIGWVAYVDLHNQDSGWDRAQWFFLSKKEDFYTFLDKHLIKKTKLYLFAHQADYDVKVMGLFDELPKRGWELSFDSCEPNKFIAKFRKDTRTLVVLDVMNLFPMSLEDLGLSVGEKKQNVEFIGAVAHWKIESKDESGEEHVTYVPLTREELIAYCKQDVKVMLMAMRRWFSFLREHDFGCFSPTMASQAFHAFTHKYMHNEIFVHNNKAAIELERDAYFGGRTEVGLCGREITQPIAVTDVNSLYPTVMRSTFLPTKLLYGFTNITVSKLEDIIRDHFVVASVTIKTDEPAYPYRTKTGVIFPIGEFKTSLCGEELRYAVSHGHVRRVWRGFVYNQAIIFDTYVEALYALRRQYEEAGDKAYSMFLKRMLNSAYGKFGQRRRSWEKVGDCLLDEQGKYYVIDIDGHVSMERRIGGRVERVVDKGNAFNAFVAVAAGITAAARMYIYALRKKVPPKEFFYSDTDSLHVSLIGLASLKDDISADKELGKLKLEGIGLGGIYHAPKDYVLYDYRELKGVVYPSERDLLPGKKENKVHIKGVSEKSPLIAENTYRVAQWERISSAVGDGTLDRQRIVERVKVLRRVYDKGVVGEDGYVTPFVLSSSSSLP